MDRPSPPVVALVLNWNCADDTQQCVAALRRSTYPSLQILVLDNASTGCCLFLRGTALQRIDLFDERYFLYFEDVDLSRRLANAGFAVGVCVRTAVTHRETHPTTLPSPRSAYYLVRNSLLLFSEHAAEHGVSRHAVTARLLHRHLLNLRSVAALIRRDPVAVASFRGVRDFFSGHFGPSRFMWNR